MKEITLNDGPKRKRRRDRSRTEGSRREGSREERHRRAEGLEQPQRTPGSERSRREGSQGRSGRYEQQPVKPELPKKKHSRTPLIVAGIVVLIMVAVYLGFGVYYMDRFFPGTTVNGIDVSGKTVKEVENLVANQVQDYVLRVHEKDNKTEQIDGADIQFEYVSDGAAQQLKYSQNSFLWINAYFHPQEYTMTTPTVYNKAKLKEAMEKLDAFDSDKVTEPKDAYIDETSSGFEIVEEVEGNQLDEDKVYELLCQAVTDGKTEVNLEESDCYLKPKKTSDNKKLKKKLASLQKYWDMTVTYEIGDASDVLDYQTFKDWMTVDSSGNVSFDWNHIADWIGQLADKYDTFGTDETFHTSLGETVTVTSMNYGWKMDEETEAAWLDETLKSGESATRQPQWLESAMARGEENDIGDTYVEIDITNQRMWFYKDGQCLVDTPVVTGDATKDGYETPLGLYCLFDKEAKAILRGADNLTGKSYNTPVDYWMPFNGGVGIHDAKWRASFGGTLYQGNGSHGCVNTPWDQAGIIFDNIEIGTPIVVYKSSINQGTGSVAISQPAETRVINEQGVEVTPESSAAGTTTGTTTDTLSDPTSYTAIDGQ